MIKNLDRYFDSNWIAIGGQAAQLGISAIINLDSEDKVLNALTRQLPITIAKHERNTVTIKVQALIYKIRPV